MSTMKGNDFEQYFPNLSNTIKNWDELTQWHKYMDLPAEEKKKWPFGAAPEYYEDIKHKCLPRF